MKKIIILLLMGIIFTIPAFADFQQGLSGNTYTPSLTEEIDYVGGTNPIYIGQAFPGSATSLPVWRIEKITYDGNNNPTVILWSPKYGNFGDIWDNRASLSYS